MSPRNLEGAAAAAQPYVSEEFFNEILKPLFAGKSTATDLPHAAFIEQSIYQDFHTLSFDKLKELHEIFSRRLVVGSLEYVDPSTPKQGMFKKEDVTRISTALVTNMAAVAVAAATQNERGEIAGYPDEPGKLVLVANKSPHKNKPPYNFKFTDLDNASNLTDYAAAVNLEDGAENVKVTEKGISFANISAMENFYTCVASPKTGETSLASSAAPTPSVSRAASVAANIAGRGDGTPSRTAW